MKNYKSFDPYHEMKKLIKEGYRDFSVLKGKLFFISTFIFDIFPKKKHEHINTVLIFQDAYSLDT